MPAVSQLQHDTDLDLLTPSEAAQALKLTNERSLERWRTEGTGPDFVKLGRRVAYRRQDLRVWLEQRVRKST